MPEYGGGGGGPRILAPFRDAEQKTAMAKWGAAHPSRGWFKLFLCISLPPLLFGLFFAANVAAGIFLELQDRETFAGWFHHKPKSPSAAEALAIRSSDPAAFNKLLTENVDRMVKDFVGQTNYVHLIDNIWSEFPEMNIPKRVAQAMHNSKALSTNLPQPINKTLWKMKGVLPGGESGDLIDPEVFLRMKIADSQYSMCRSTLWVMVEKGKVSRAAAASAEPTCDQIKEMMKVVDLENVVNEGSEALTKEQQGMLNGIMGRTMQDVFKAAYQSQVLFSPPSTTHELEPADGDILFQTKEDSHIFAQEDLKVLADTLLQQRAAALIQDDRLTALHQDSYELTAPPGPPDLLAALEETNFCKKQNENLENLLRLRYCQMESTVRNPAGATLVESVAASILQVHNLPSYTPPSPATMLPIDQQARNAMMERIKKLSCRIILVGTTDERFPLFLEKVLDAVRMPHCQITIYEPNPKYKSSLQQHLREDAEAGTQLTRTRVVMTEVTNFQGTYQVQMPGRPAHMDAAHAVDPNMMMRDGKGREIPVGKEQVHYVTVSRKTLDEVLCEPLSVNDVPREISQHIPFCDIGETPIVAIAAHSDPTSVLLSFTKMRQQAHPAAIIWEAPHTTNIELQVDALKGGNYSVYVALLQPPDIVVGHPEPQLVRLDVDEHAVRTVKGLMAYHKVNVALVAIRRNHPYLQHAKHDLIMCETPCHLGKIYNEFISARDDGGLSCHVPDMCMCAGTGGSTQVLDQMRNLNAASAAFANRKLLGVMDLPCVMLHSTWEEVMAKLSPALLTKQAASASAARHRAAWAPAEAAGAKAEAARAKAKRKAAAKKSKYKLGHK